MNQNCDINRPCNFLKVNDYPNVKRGDLNYFALLDFETYGLITIRNGILHFPVISEFAINVYNFKTIDVSENCQLGNEEKCYCADKAIEHILIRGDNIEMHVVSIMINLKNKYPNIYFGAYNGYAFDFPILFNIFVTHNHYFSEFKLFDTFHIKRLFNMRAGKNKDFVEENFSKCYEKHLANLHTAAADILIMLPETIDIIKNITKGKMYFIYGSDIFSIFQKL